MVSTKWTYHKKRSFASNYFIFWKFCFSLRTSYKELIWYTNYPNVHIRIYCKCWSFIWRRFFSVSILKKRQRKVNLSSFLFLLLWGYFVTLLFNKYFNCHSISNFLIKIIKDIDYNRNQSKKIRCTIFSLKRQYIRP